VGGSDRIYFQVIRQSGRREGQTEVFKEEVRSDPLSYNKIKARVLRLR